MYLAECDVVTVVCRRLNKENRRRSPGLEKTVFVVGGKEYGVAREEVTVCVTCHQRQRKDVPHDSR
jgi:cytochrome c553